MEATPWKSGASTRGSEQIYRGRNLRAPLLLHKTSFLHARWLTPALQYTQGATGLEHVSVGDVAKEKECFEGRDVELDTNILDEEKVLQICNLLYISSYILSCACGKARHGVISCPRQSL